LGAEVSGQLSTGLHRNIPAEQYHADPESISNTMLSAMNKSPAHCYWLHLAPNRPTREPTPAMMGGTLAHTAILEPDALRDRYVVKPDGMRFSTKDGMAWRDQQTSAIISREEFDAAEAQRAAVHRVTALSNLLRTGDAESSVFWNDTATGLRCRARPDWLHWSSAESVTVLDIKTIGELTPDAVQRAISTYGYHRQAAHYVNGMEAIGLHVEEFVFGFVSSSYPYLAAAYVLDDESIAQGRDEVGELLSRFNECQKAGNWPAFGDGYQLTSLPTWAKRSSEVEIEVIQ
jgi:PDDEXK-like domain of unknown function (DUF3799)